MDVFTKNHTKIVAAIQNGEVIFMPTDTICGLVASAKNPAAVECIYALKERDLHKQPTTLIASTEQLTELGGVTLLPNDIYKKYWPGPVSLIHPCFEPQLRHLHRGNNEMSFRLPNLLSLHAILEETGPLATSSANLQGQPPATTTEEARAYFNDQISCFIETDTPIAGPPSTVIRINHDGSEEVIR